MKKKIFIFCVVLLAIISGLFFAYHQNEINRYSITSPMMDFEYKKTIIKDSKNLTYKVENLRPLVGQEELKSFIKENDDNPAIYIPSEDNLQKNVFRANLHMHSTNSDGSMSVEEILNQAQNYAHNFPDGKYMYVAITDHNTVLGSKEIVRVLEKNPHKYTKIKVIPGIEIYSNFKTKYSPEKDPDIHILTWCINPFDKFLNEEFFKADLTDQWNNNKRREFEDVISYMSQKGIVGIGHPVRYITYLNDKKYAYIDELLATYKKHSNNTLFLEGYYQSYPCFSEKDELGDDYDNFINYINAKAKENGIIRTGSLDTHGVSIFKYRD